MSAAGDWPEVCVATTLENAEAVEAWLFAAGALSITFRDHADQPILEPAPGEMRLWEALTLVGLFGQNVSDDDVHSALLLAAASQSYSAPTYELSRLRDVAWERTWMDTFHSMRFGNNLWVCPTHADPPDPNGIIIRLDPGLAFGSGTHPTTAQCLHFLGQWDVQAVSLEHDEQPQSKPALAGLHVIDYGCGSGILAVAAALLGAQSVRAVDIDHQALVATKRNAEANNVESIIACGSPDQLNNAQTCDLLLANILCEPLLELAPRFADLIDSGGTLVMSGLLVNQIERIKLRYNEWFNFSQSNSQDEWALLVAPRSQ